MPGGLGSPGHNRPIGEINVTPLVDVMLVLLVIFILTAPLLAQAIRVNLPRVAAQTPAEPEVVRLALYADGHAELDGAPVDAQRLRQRLADALVLRPDLVLTLDADEDVAYRRVAELLAAARQAGVQRLSLSTRAPP
jgi:biopolymer transport protein ExbD